MMSALSAAELGVAGYGDLSPYGALWEHHHHPPAYHHPHPADLLAAGFPADLWVGAGAGSPQPHRMLPQRFGGVPVGLDGRGGGGLAAGLGGGLGLGEGPPPKPGSTTSHSSSPSLGSVGSLGANASGKKTRRRVATMAQRRAANIRERRRMYNLNEAFDKLRRKVPTFAYEKRLSRIETLRLAITYISFMTELIGGDAGCRAGGRASPKAADSYAMGVGVPSQRGYPHAGYPLLPA